MVLNWVQIQKRLRKMQKSNSDTMVTTMYSNLSSTGAFVEAGRADLAGVQVGATVPLVKKKFKEAQGGVLFIDEAYSLCDS